MLLINLLKTATLVVWQFIITWSSSLEMAQFVY